MTYSIDFGGNWDSDAAKEKSWSGRNAPNVTTCGNVGECKGGNLRALLDSTQLKAMAANEPAPLDGFEGVLMHPLGGSIGGKRCRFKLELSGCMVLIADQKKYRGDWPNVKLEVSGEKCLCYPGGAEAGYLQGVRLLAAMGAEIHRERVNRVDVCADLPGWSMQGFIGLALDGRYTCRSRNFLPRIYPTGETLLWGEGGAIMLRIYNKLKEQELKSLRGSPAKFEHMVAHRWGGRVPESAVRVEFQLRRIALKALGVTDYDSFFEQFDEVMKYLTGQGAALERWDTKKNQYVSQANARWFRYLKKRPDNKHPERNEVNPRWAIVQRLFSRAHLADMSTMREIQPGNADISALVKQAFGVLMTAASNRGYTMPGRLRSVAPERYRFYSYEAFEAWMCDMLRTVAREIPEFNLMPETARFSGEEADPWWLDDCEVPEDVLELIRRDEEAAAANELESIGML